MNPVTATRLDRLEVEALDFGIVGQLLGQVGADRPAVVVKTAGETRVEGAKFVKIMGAPGTDIQSCATNNGITRLNRIVR